MNLFFIGWNLSNQKVPLVLSEIEKMKAVYPILDPKTLWSFSQENKVFVASMHTASEVAAPRVYVDKSDNQVVLYEGSPVARTGSFCAHNAKALASHWNDLPSSLEGNFVAARIRRNPGSLEIINDALGLSQVYYLRQDNMWLISNSSLLLGRISNITELDPLGVSFFLCYGAGGSDRTLRQGIRVIPEAQHWQWQEGMAEIKRSNFYPRSCLSGKSQKKLNQGKIDNLAEEMIQICQNLADNFGTLNCPITAGRDSRLMTALLIRGKIDANYFTHGLRESPDIRIAAQIANHFDLPHQKNIESAIDDNLISNWEETSKLLIQQNDGLLTLRGIKLILKQSLSLNRLGITLYGAGGEIARGYYNSAQFFIGSDNLVYVKKYLSNKLIGNKKEILYPEAVLPLQEYIEEFALKAIDQGFAPIDVPDLFHTYEQVRRWVGVRICANQSVHRDVFSPFCTRPFLEAAYSISPLLRYCEYIHYELLKYLVPDLHRLYWSQKWRYQQPMINLIHSVWEQTVSKKIVKPIKKISSGKFKSVSLDLNHRAGNYYRLELKRSQLRELCLDQSHSSLWNFIDRARFERITSSEINPLEREKHVNLLWEIFTLFQYADLTGC